MTDNLANKGIRDDEPVGSRRMKPKGKRKKPWAIEWRIKRHVSNGLARTLGLRGWMVYNRYTTEFRRDQALAALVKKAEGDALAARYHWKQEYRKLDD